jgi:hypothetical protein
MPRWTTVSKGYRCLARLSRLGAAPNRRAFAGAQTWLAWSIQPFAFDKWITRRLVSLWAILGSLCQEGVARPERRSENGELMLPLAAAGD